VRGTRGEGGVVDGSAGKGFHLRTPHSGLL
jgi:hypothetical protein